MDNSWSQLTTRIEETKRSLAEVTNKEKRRLLLAEMRECLRDADAKIQSDILRADKKGD